MLEPTIRTSRLDELDGQEMQHEESHRLINSELNMYVRCTLWYIVMTFYVMYRLKNILLWKPLTFDLTATNTRLSPRATPSTPRWGCLWSGCRGRRGGCWPSPSSSVTCRHTPPVLLKRAALGEFSPFSPHNFAQLARALAKFRTTNEVNWAMSNALLPQLAFIR